MRSKIRLLCSHKVSDTNNFSKEKMKEIFMDSFYERDVDEYLFKHNDLYTEFKVINVKFKLLSKENNERIFVAKVYGKRLPQNILDFIFGEK